MEYIAGLDIGGTKMVLGLYEHTSAGISLLTEHFCLTPSKEGALEVVKCAADLLNKAQAETGQKAQALGVGTTGVVDPVQGTITAAANTITGWAGFELRRRLEEATGIPVQVENDVNAFLLGEAAHAERSQPMGAVLGLMLGTGIGGAALVDGQLLRGKYGAAVEIGHMPGFENIVGERDYRCNCGRKGHAEMLASGRGIALQYALLKHAHEESFSSATVVPTRTGKEVADLAAAGDETALRVFAHAGQQLGQAIMAACTVLDLDTVILGGSVAKAREFFMPSLNEYLDRNLAISGERVRIVPAQLGDAAVKFGAAVSAARSFS